MYARTWIWTVMYSPPGAVAGKAKGIISDNYFVDNGYGAVDGVTREAEAVPMDYASLAGSENYAGELSEVHDPFYGRG